MSTVLPVRTPRVLACVLCQHRKIKCDRNTPCSNCLKANVTCTPSTPAPARKRRRPNQDLQQRLARCEELLQEYATAKPSPASNETPSADDRYKTVGKLIDDDGSVRFMDSFLWANVHDELRAMREILDSDDKDDESCSTPADGQTPDQHTALLFSDGSSESLEDLHPEPAHVFRLWQTFVDRVNPLTKVIHVPTIQPLLVEAATNRAALPKNVEALLFAIYTMAAVALSDNESLSMLGCSKEQAFDRFSKGVRIALMRIGILNKYDLVVLQAMVLYLVSLSGRYDRHAAWVLNGVIVRIAQKMGLHRDGTTLGLSPFETEIRRRLWWQIILLDCTYALMSGLTHSPLPRNWDTKKPTNINDADLFPTMKSIEEREGPTDMIFILISYEIAQLLLEAPGFESIIHQNEQGLADKPTNTDVETARARIEELNQRLTEILTQYGDLSLGPVHEFSMQLCPMMVRKMQELICPPREQPEWGTEVLTPKDHLFKIAVQEGEHSLGLYEITQKRGTFLWFVMTHFQVEVFHFMTGYLNMRTTGQLVERAWVVTEQTYKFHTELFNLSVKPHASLAIFVLRAWRKREDMLREIKGFPPERPYYITQLTSLLESDGATKEETPFDQSLPDAATPDKGGIKTVEMPWDHMLGFVDASTIDWTTFGETVPQATGFPSFGQGGASGWM